MPSIIVFDTETTGLPQPNSAPLDQQPEIIELAAIKLDFKTLKEKARMEFMCRPKKLPLDPVITKITGIKDEDLADKKSFAFHLPSLVKFTLGTDVLCAHNLAFDTDLLSFELQRLSRLIQFPWPPEHLCTVEASMPINGHRMRLKDLHKLATGQEHKDQHRAMADVEALVTVLKYLRKEGHV